VQKGNLRLEGREGYDVKVLCLVKEERTLGDLGHGQCREGEVTSI